MGLLPKCISAGVFYANKCSLVFGGVGRKLRLLTELLRNSRIFLLTLILIGALRGFAKRLPRRGGSGRHDKAEKMAEVACCKKLHFVLVQTLKLVQGDGRSFRKLATSGIYGATRGCSEGETSPPFIF